MRARAARSTQARYGGTYTRHAAAALAIAALIAVPACGDQADDRAGDAAEEAASAAADAPSASDAAAVRATYTRIFRALMNGNGEAACASMTQATQRGVAQGLGGGPNSTCAETASRLRRGLTASAGFKILNVDIRGDVATVRVLVSQGRNPQEFQFVKQGRKWKLNDTDG